MLSDNRIPGGHQCHQFKPVNLKRNNFRLSHLLIKYEAYFDVASALHIQGFEERAISKAPDGYVATLVRVLPGRPGARCDHAGIDAHADAVDGVAGGDGEDAAALGETPDADSAVEGAGDDEVARGVEVGN